jgi:hypothetical protein
MKYIFFLLALLIGGTVYAQPGYRIRADSTILERVGGNNELILKNSTKAVKGILTNIGSGHTQFLISRKSGDTLFVGKDTILGVGSGGGNVYKVGTPTANQLPIWTGDGTIKGIDTAGLFGGGGGGTQVGGLQFGFARNVSHGKFWYQDSSYTLCNWQAWVKATNPSADGYFISDGHGGMHNVLLGVITNTTHAQFTGNFYDGTGIISMAGVDNIPLNQWVHIQFIYDGTYIKCLLNGVTTFLQPFTGVRKTISGGSDGTLYIGGSDHSNFPGIVKQIKGLEGSTGGVGFQDYSVYKYLNQYYPDGSKASFLSDYSVKGTRLFTDQGAGFAARSHDGVFSNATQSPVWGQPEWVEGDVTQDTTAPALTSVPGGALVYDGFSRRNKLYMWFEAGGLDSTEGGSLGKLKWNTTSGLGNSAGTGVLYGRATMYAEQCNFAWVNTASQNADIRVTRPNQYFPTGLFTRYDGDNFYRIVASNTQIDFEFREAGVTTYPASFTGITGGWTVLRVVVSGTTMSVYCDATLVGTKTIVSNPAGVGHGLGSAGTASYYDNFTIY